MQTTSRQSPMPANYDEYLKTDYWKTVSAAVKRRAGHRCQVCNSPHDLAAHHRTYEHRGSELAYLDDLIALCRRCHSIFHGKDAPTLESSPKIGAGIARAKHAEKSRSSHRQIRMAQESCRPIAIPDLPEFLLTADHVNACRTMRGAFTSATLQALGVPIPPLKGWPSRLCGTVITRERYRAALEGRAQFA